MQNKKSTPPAGSPPLLEVRDLRVWFPVKTGIFARTAGWIKAVDGVSFSLRKGETLAVVDGKVLVGEVYEHHTNFAPVVGIDGARGVEHGDTML